jgi:hypothetical protein
MFLLQKAKVQFPIYKHTSGYHTLGDVIVVNKVYYIISLVMHSLHFFVLQKGFEIKILICSFRLCFFPSSLFVLSATLQSGDDQPSRYIRSFVKRKN